MAKSDSDPMMRFNNLVKGAFVLALLLMAYNLWSFFNSSRYQALCNASYWEMNKTQLDSCLDAKRELDK
ncbi:hypothetical protein [Methylocystis parvus]|uniref:Uncharacterized protein n=1 Tax=Methylocystis parvus TaxID=134 RepID=A0A6B8M9E1_9HYPH|nr:hypothetical protein [Methylocystis parvus]QGM98199.1 hypothetical protein F7D14_12435 [Methylocystis parvus]WBK01474.1 hypothetical protein MMG94_07140 [Methylocystis parvus OBBP]